MFLAKYSTFIKRFCIQPSYFLLEFFLLPDMFLDKADSSTVLRSWIGQSVDFVCTIILKVGADSPSFKWKNVDKNITFPNDKTSGTRTKSVLTIIPKSESDFGTYKCYARTSRAKIKHNMTLIKVGKLA